jgi:hypothetical protein
VRRDTTTQWMAALVLIGSLAGSSVMALQLTASGGRNRLGYTETTAEGQPPQVALGIAMGAFRGLFVNFLWIRANDLKEKGRFHESMDLARAITTLQPRFPQVWAFHAWNMAYNISVSTQTASERWKWVSNGIALLRDEGIVANPNDLLVHKELAWIFLHKIGGWMDDANLYYKKRLAGEWSLVLGPPPPVDPLYKNREAVTKAFADWLQPIADAPGTLDDLYAQTPSTRDLVNRLRADVQMEPDFRVNQNYIVLDTIRKSGQRGFLESGFNPRQKAMMALIEDTSLAEAWSKLLPYIRRKVLTETYHMEPDRMIRYTQMYGPLDWRHWGSHGLYWGLRGVENSYGRVTLANRKDYDYVNSNRVVVQAIQDLWRAGDMYFDLLGYIRNPDDPNTFARYSPNIHYIDAYAEHLEYFIRKSWADNPNRAYTMMSAGYENFRKDAIRFLYRRGEKDAATRMKDELAVWPYHNINDPDRAELFAMDIDDFVKKELEDALSRPSVAREEIVGSLQGAYTALLAGSTDAFNGQMAYARMVHEYYFKKQGHFNLVDPNTPRMAQIDPNFPVLAGSEFAALMMQLNLDDAERLFDRADDALKVWAYDLIKERFGYTLDQLAAQGGRPFEKVFPEPKGMAEHRQYVQQHAKELEETKPAIEQK